MSSFPLQPNPPSISHTNTSTHICTSILSHMQPFLPVSVASPSPAPPFHHFCNSSLCASLLLLLSPSLFFSPLLPTSSSLSLPEAYPREPDWSSGCLFGVQLIGHMGTLGHKEGRQKEAYEVKGKKGNNGCDAPVGANTWREEVVDVTVRSSVCLHHQVVTF